MINKEFKEKQLIPNNILAYFKYKFNLSTDTYTKYTNLIDTIDYMLYTHDTWDKIFTIEKDDLYTKYKSMKERYIK